MFFYLPERFLSFQVANKLYPLSSISQNIEDFANEMLVSTTSFDHTVEKVEAEGSNTESHKVCFYMLLMRI